MVEIKKEDDASKGRFVLYEGESYAGELNFTWAGTDKFIIDHTAVDDAFEGKGYGKKLVQHAAEFAHKEEVKVIPLCPFAKALFEKDAKLRDLSY